MNEQQSLFSSMQQTIEHANLEFIGEIGEICIDATLDEGLIKSIPIISSIVGIGKCFQNIHDICFAKKLIAFLLPIKDITSEQRMKAIQKWEQDKNYRDRVGETLIGMIERCDDSIKATWLSQLFYEFVLRREEAQFFMRAEKNLSSLSVMDVQAFLNMKLDLKTRIKEDNCIPYLWSGLFKNPRESIVGHSLNLTNRTCEPTEIGLYIYNILNNNQKTDTKP